MLNLMGINNNLQLVAETIAKEYGGSVAAIIKDWQRQQNWVPVIEQKKEMASIMNARLEYLNRASLELLQSVQNTGASVKEKFVKIGAINACLRVTAEQIKLGMNLGHIERQPIEIITNDLSMPYEFEPNVKLLIDDAAAKLVEQKRLIDEAEAEKQKKLEQELLSEKEAVIDAGDSSEASA
jgi:hypothetical protein